MKKRVEDYLAQYILQLRGSKYIDRPTANIQPPDQKASEIKGHYCKPGG
jgi:hypothetical protein